MTVITRRTAISALATLGIAGAMLTGGAANASSSADRQTAVAQAAPCWTSVSQPSGPQTTIFVTYRNCGSLSQTVTVSSSAVDNSGTFTYVNRCRTVRAGVESIFAIEPAAFPAQNTNRYTVTTCMLQ